MKVRSLEQQESMFPGYIHGSNYDVNMISSLIKEAAVPMATVFRIVSFPEEAAEAVCFSMLRVNFADSCCRY